MNIIRDYVLAEKFQYLLHMEDDWQFFAQRKYVEPAIAILDGTRRTNGLPLYGQVLFNRNYAEIESCIEISGGVVKYTPQGTRIVEHEHLEEEEFQRRYSGCLHNAYWPHYSLRPSLLDCKMLFLIGRYSENAGHFEMEYAFRYEKLFKSCFWDTICCLHTGKLTSESSKANAYSLNDQAQFGEKRIVTE